MQVLILNYEFPPMGGGAGYASYNLANQLAQRGHGVTVLTSRFGDQPKREVLNGVRILRCYSWRKSIHDCGLRGAVTYLLTGAISMLSLKAQQDFDVLHFFFSFPTGLLSFLPYAFRDKPYVVSLRGSDVPGYDPYNKKLQHLHKLLLPLNRRVCRRAARVVALSQSLKSMALAKMPELKIDVIPNGIEVDHFQPLKCYNEDKKGFLFITVSRLVNRKGIDLILRALKDLKEENEENLELLVVGTGNCQSELKKLAVELGLGKSIHFHGYCDRQKLPELYNKACAFILPSHAESFGMVFGEAMACGLPIIGTNTGGIPDLVAEDCGILVDCDNVEQIKDAIVKIVSSARLRKSLGDNGCRRINTHFTWEAVANQYESIYRRIRNCRPEVLQSSGIPKAA